MTWWKRCRPYIWARRWCSAPTPTSCSRCTSRNRLREGLARGGAQAEFVALDSHQGHDAFLVDIEQFAPPIRNFLNGLKS